ncbi:MAG: tRNA lysidine(34) synthetase TilS, partial [bacterium]
MPNDCGHLVRLAAERAARNARVPLVLAVSGGLDSMALLGAMDDVAHGQIAAVATFDHGTGAAATVAARHVCRAAAQRGLPVVSARADRHVAATAGREAAWREQRWRFLRAAAAGRDAMVATAHTEDDQIETVLMRTMRGSGARGLAGLRTDTDVLRPFLDVRRSQLASYALAAGLEWVEDPSNASSDFFRNRVRHDVLPALRSVQADFDDGLLDIARRAAELRREIERFVDERVKPTVVAGHSVRVASQDIVGFDRSSLAVLWGAVAGRAGLALDRRGTRRIAEFTMCGRSEGHIPLAGGWCLEATRASYILKRDDVMRSPPVSLPVRGAVQWGPFRFRVVNVMAPPSVWAASISPPEGAVVRIWSAGDRLAPAAGQPRRRVSRYLSDVGLRGRE